MSCGVAALLDGPGSETAAATVFQVSRGRKSQSPRQQVLERLRQAVVPRRNERVVEKVVVKCSCNIRQSGLLQNTQHSLF